MVSSKRPSRKVAVAVFISNRLGKRTVETTPSILARSHVAVHPRGKSWELGREDVRCQEGEDFGCPSAFGFHHSTFAGWVSVAGCRLAARLMGPGEHRGNGTGNVHAELVLSTTEGTNRPVKGQVHWPGIVFRGKWRRLAETWTRPRPDCQRLPLLSVISVDSCSLHLHQGPSDPTAQRRGPPVIDDPAARIVRLPMYCGITEEEKQPRVAGVLMACCSAACPLCEAKQPLDADPG